MEQSHFIFCTRGGGRAMGLNKKRETKNKTKGDGCKTASLWGEPFKGIKRHEVVISTRLENFKRYSDISLTRTQENNWQQNCFVTAMDVKARYFGGYCRYTNGLSIATAAGCKTMACCATDIPSRINIMWLEKKLTKNRIACITKLFLITNSESHLWRHQYWRQTLTFYDNTDK